MWLLDLLYCLLDIVLAFADILLWPEQAANRRSRREAKHRGPRPKWEVLPVVFILMAVIGLCLLLLWKCSGPR